MEQTSVICKRTMVQSQCICICIGSSSSCEKKKVLKYQQFARKVPGKCVYLSENDNEIRSGEKQKKKTKHMAFILTLGMQKNNNKKKHFESALQRQKTYCISHPCGGR